MARRSLLDIIWRNGTRPAINETNLNAMTNAINSNTSLLDDTMDNLDELTTSTNDKVAALNTRVNNIAQIPPGGTTGDAELRDIRVGYNNQTYPNAGSAVRGQVSDLHTALRFKANQTEVDAIKDDLLQNSYGENGGGKNILVPVEKQITASGIKCEFTKKPSLKLNGQATNTTYQTNNDFTLKAGTYTFSISNINNSDHKATIFIRRKSDNVYLAQVLTNSTKSASFTLTEDTLCFIGFFTQSSAANWNEDINIQLEEGTATSYEPYIKSNHQLTNDVEEINNSLIVKTKEYANGKIKLHYQDNGMAIVHLDGCSVADWKDATIPLLSSPSRGNLTAVNIGNNRYYGFLYWSNAYFKQAFYLPTYGGSFTELQADSTATLVGSIVCLINSKDIL